MASKVSICNMALAALGVGDLIANVDTERSAEARACKLFYDDTVKEVLRDFKWPFANKIQALALIAESPNDEWAYSYRYPIDCLMLDRILSGQRTDTRDTREPYKLSSDDGGALLYCDKATAEAEYTAYEDDPQRYPPDFSAAVSYLLAVRIAPMVTGGDPFGQQEKNLKLYSMQILKAQSNAGKEEQPDIEPEAETIRVR